ncbi:MAG: CoA ester lyase, partial [Sphingomonas sp.]|nr:CoA ester lyase [Sphingomonas sp.]
EWPMSVAIRVNAIGSEWHSVDVDAVSRSGVQFAVLPRTASAHLLHGVREAIAKPTLAMIETAAGVLAAAQIASEAAGLIAGTNDLSADLRLPLDAGRQPLQAALQMTVLAARATGIPVFDGVFNDLEDLEGFVAECGEGRSLGVRRQEPHPPVADRAVQPRFPAVGERGRACTAAG